MARKGTSLGCCVACLAGLFAFSTNAQIVPSQHESSSQEKPITSAQLKVNPSAPCVEPAPVVKLSDYNGPLKKTVGLFARALERNAVHTPRRYKPGTLLCALTVKGKFMLFAEDSLDPVTFLSSGFWAATDQASDRDPTFGQGAAGYAKRYLANYTDQAQSEFLKDFAYPSIFSEDPRYYRIGQGKVGKRLLHAATHVFVAYRFDGTYMPNYSEWLGTVSSVALSNAYHPGNTRGVGPAAIRVANSVAQDVGFDVLREFWPAVSRALKLPFRGEREQSQEGAEENR